MAEGDVYKLTTVMEHQGSKQITWGLHGRQPGILAPNAEALGGDIVDWWNAIRDLYNVAILLKSVTLQRVRPLEQQVFIHDVIPDVPGLATGDDLPPQVAVVTTLRTALVGRSFRGRCFLPPPSEGVVDAALSVAAADQMNNAFTSLRSQLAATNFEPVVFSKFSGTDANGDPIPRAVPIDTVITVNRTDRRLRSQRRRVLRAPVYQD